MRESLPNHGGVKNLKKTIKTQLKKTEAGPWGVPTHPTPGSEPKKVPDQVQASCGTRRQLLHSAVACPRSSPGRSTAAGRWTCPSWRGTGPEHRKAPRRSMRWREVCCRTDRGELGFANWTSERGLAGSKNAIPRKIIAINLRNWRPVRKSVGGSGFHPQI